MRAMALGALAGAVLLAGCEDGSDPAKDAADVAEIEAMHDMPPADMLKPERISYTDIEKNNLFGAGCGFAPEDSTAILFLAQEKHGFVKLDKRIVTLSPDVGSTELPMKAYGKYDGKEFAAELTIDQAADGEQSGIETTQYPGKLVLHDTKGRTVFERTGTVGCGA
ncbi:hypothetical protein [Croceicoccus naphthovorans]|uniref:hypothetical protein n=1 Tax=Croceicoccus naphthovorans TaxID=1348774 RepID=UPI000B148AC4|nr:hypothetical protein [Croceicoccus naphthovorans]MBB3991199.1 hypothetical protein [Croceicoccus naphthovorans]